MSGWSLENETATVISPGQRAADVPPGLENQQHRDELITGGHMDDIRVSETRERKVTANVNGEEWLYTPAGKSPIEPFAIDIRYSMAPDTGEVSRIHVEVRGNPVGGDRFKTIIRHLIQEDMAGEHLLRGWLLLEQAPAWVKEAVERLHPETKGEEE